MPQVSADNEAICLKPQSNEYFVFRAPMLIDYHFNIHLLFNSGQALAPFVSSLSSYFAHSSFHSNTIFICSSTQVVLSLLGMSHSDATTPIKGSTTVLPICIFVFVLVMVQAQGRPQPSASPATPPTVMQAQGHQQPSADPATLPPSSSGPQWPTSGCCPAAPYSSGPQRPTSSASYAVFAISGCTSATSVDLQPLNYFGRSSSVPQRPTTHRLANWERLFQSERDFKKEL